MFDKIQRFRKTIFIGLFFLAACCAHAIAPSVALAEDFSGVDRYDTAAREAKAAFPNGADSAIVVTGEHWSDALATTGLAGCLNAPILFVSSSSLPNYTAKTIGELGVSSILVVGNTSSVSPKVESALGALKSVRSVERLAGEGALGTQMAVYKYGLKHDLWSDSRIIITSGEVFPDALSASPLAFVGHSPVFLTFGGALSAEQETALLEHEYDEILVLGGTSAVSERTFGYLRAAALRNSGSTDAVIRLAGVDRWETSALIAQWATSKKILSWQNAAITTAYKPYDALAGSTLQGRRGAVLLLADRTSSMPVQRLIEHRAGVTSVSFFGDTNTIPTNLRNYVRSHLGIYIPSASVDTACFIQYPELPTGCEAVSLTNALTHYGFSLSKFTIFDHYLPFSTWDFVSCYVGNPYTSGGSWNSCCAPALVRAANNYLTDYGSSLRAYEITGTSFNDLYAYIEQGYPVIVWNTINMAGPGGVWASQTLNGHEYRLYDGTHTVVLKGFDRPNGTVTIADPIAGNVVRDAGTFGWVYSYIGAQAVVVM